MGAYVVNLLKPTVMLFKGNDKNNLKNYFNLISLQ